MKKHIKKEYIAWYILIPLLLILSIYGYVAESFIEKQDWVWSLYSNKFSSIMPKHLSLWSLVVLVNIVIMLSATKQHSRVRLIYKLYLVLMTAGFSMWFAFDAFTRSFATLNEILITLTPSDVMVIILMSLFEIITSLTIISISMFLIWKVTKNYHKCRSEKVDKLFYITDWFSIGVFLLVFISQSLVFLSYTQAGIQGLVHRRFPSIGPESQGLFALAGAAFAWRRIRVTKKYNTERDWRMVVITTLLFCLVGGFMFHDNSVFIHDYVNSSGAYNNGVKVWGASNFVNVSTTLLIITIPLILAVVSSYIMRFTLMIIFITKKDKKCL